MSGALVPRFAVGLAAEALDAFPAVVVQGARQVGKSTFARQLVADRPARVLTLDDPAALAAARSDPVAFVDQLPDGTLLVDEVQRAPELVLPIKAAIDRDRRPGRFVLTGSSDLLRLSRTPDSLAGRAVTIGLHPFTQGELRGRRDDLVGRIRAGADPAAFRSDTSRDDYAAIIARGGYPEVRALAPRMRNMWFDSYVERLLERDVADLAPRVDRDRIAAVLRLLAAAQAGELVTSRIARDARIPESSARAYRDLLETMYLTTRLRPWTPNLTSREVARPKTLLVDPALALRLARVTEQQLVPLGNPHLGAAMEGFVATELLRQRPWSAEEFELFHYRDRDGLEVDLVAELADGSVLGIEVKAGSTTKPEHLRGLRALRDRLGSRFVAGVVLNGSATGAALGDRLWSLPVAALWEL